MFTPEKNLPFAEKFLFHGLIMKDKTVKNTWKKKMTSASIVKDNWTLI
jgi:hypothetical protein